MVDFYGFHVGKYTIVPWMLWVLDPTVKENYNLLDETEHPILLDCPNCKKTPENFAPLSALILGKATSTACHFANSMMNEFHEFLQSGKILSHTIISCLYEFIA